MRPTCARQTAVRLKPLGHRHANSHFSFTAKPAALAVRACRMAETYNELGSGSSFITGAHSAGSYLGSEFGDLRTAQRNTIIPWCSGALERAGFRTAAEGRHTHRDTYA